MGRPLPAGLGLALDKEIEPALVATLESRFGAPTRVRGVKSSVLKRRALRYELELEGPASRLTLIGKVYETREAGERGLAALRWLCARGFSSSGTRRVAVPRALAYLPELCLLLMEEAGGTSLQSMLKDGSARPEHLRLFAGALLELHGLEDVFGAPFTLDDHLAVRCAGLADGLKLSFPELARPIERILASARRCETGPLAPACTVAHGDAHAGQLLVDGTRAWLVDLDPLHQGNPGYDVAMALHSLARFEHRTDAGRAASLRQAFLATYLEHVDPSRAERIPLDLALIHLKRACKRFRWQDERAWPAAVRAEIERAERCLDLLEQARPCRNVADVIELCERLPGPAR